MKILFLVTLLSLIAFLNFINIKIAHKKRQTTSQDGHTVQINKCVGYLLRANPPGTNNTCMHMMHFNKNVVNVFCTCIKNSVKLIITDVRYSITSSIWRSKYFKDNIFAGNPQNRKISKTFPPKIVRLYSTTLEFLTVATMVGLLVGTPIRTRGRNCSWSEDKHNSFIHWLSVALPTFRIM